MGMIKKIKDNINFICIKYLKNNGLEETPIFYINGSQTLPPPLSTEEEEELLAKIDENGSETRKTLVEHNLRLVVYISKKFENTGVD